MNNAIIGLIAIGALIAGPAMAADLRMPVKAPPAPLPPTCVWCGWYVGVNAGWIGSADDTVTNTGTDTDGGGLGTVLAAGALPASVKVGYDGFIGGGQIGYNWSVANNFVFGLEADIDGIANAKKTLTVAFPGSVAFVPFSTAYTREIDWLATVRGRLGIAVAPSFLLYGTGGLAVGQVKIGNQFICAVCAPPASTESTTSALVSTTATGWTAGAGGEWMVTPQLSVKAEYLFVDLGRHSSTITYTYGANTSTLTSRVRDTENIVRAGINYHFNFGGPY